LDSRRITGFSGLNLCVPTKNRPSFPLCFSFCFCLCFALSDSDHADTFVADLSGRTRGLAGLAALGLGLAVGMCQPMRLMLEPVIEFVRPIPPLAFLPMFLVWFGLGEASKVAFIGYTTFFPMFVGIAAAVLRADVMLLRAAASLGGSRLDLLRFVVLPAALPGIVVALRLGFGLALFVIVGAEFMGADAGLGHLIMEGRAFFNPAQIVLGALLLGILGSVVNALLLAGERRALRWRTLG